MVLRVNASDFISYNLLQFKWQWIKNNKLSSSSRPSWKGSKTKRSWSCLDCWENKILIHPLLRLRSENLHSATSSARIQSLRKPLNWMTNSPPRPCSLLFERVLCIADWSQTPYIAKDKPWTPEAPAEPHSHLHPRPEFRDYRRIPAHQVYAVLRTKCTPGKHSADWAASTAGLHACRASVLLTELHPQPETLWGHLFCVRVCVCVCILWVHVEVEARNECRDNLVTPPYFWSFMFQLNWPANEPLKSASQPQRHHTKLLHGCWGAEFRSWCLSVWQAPFPLSHIPRPHKGLRQKS